MSHTPGPWRIALHDHGDGDEWCISALNEGGATDHIIAWANPGNEADARLIAAAPDLLAALHAILFAVEFNEPLSPSIEHDLQVIGERARTAIAEAKGDHHQ